MEDPADRVAIDDVSRQRDRPAAVIYARTSKGESTSLPDQINACRVFARAREWRIRYQLVDQGESGADPLRHGFQRILDLADDRAVDVLIVWKIDRIARTLADAAMLERELRLAGVALASCTEQIDTSTAIGRFIFGNLASAAQLERELIRERAQLVQGRKRREGRWMHGPPPYGYRKAKGHYLRPFPPEANIVTSLFSIYLVTKSLQATAEALNAEGSLRRGRPWTSGHVHAALHRPWYWGQPVVEGKVLRTPKTAIVPTEVAEQALALLEAAPRRGVHGPPQRRLLAFDRVLKQYLASLEFLDDEAPTSQ